MLQVGRQEDEVPSGPEHPPNLAEDHSRITQMLEHPQADDEVERLVDEGQALASALEHRHAGGAMLRERSRIGVDARRERDLPPEQLEHPAAAAPKVQDPAPRREMGSNEGLDHLAARPPART